MTDIVERLRGLFRHDDVLEAADEIERLRKDRDRLMITHGRLA